MIPSSSCPVIVLQFASTAIIICCAGRLYFFEEKSKIKDVITAAVKVRKLHLHKITSQ